MDLSAIQFCQNWNTELVYTSFNFQLYTVYINEGGPSPGPSFLLPPPWLLLLPPFYVPFPFHLGKLQTSRWMFRAVGPHQCSAAQQSTYQTTHTIHKHLLAWTTQPSSGCLTTHTINHAHTYPHSKGWTIIPIQHPWPTIPTHIPVHRCNAHNHKPSCTHKHSQFLTCTQTH